MCKSAMEAVEGAHALVLVTDWECFRSLDMPQGHPLLFPSLSICTCVDEGFASERVGRERGTSHLHVRGRIVGMCC